MNLRDELDNLADSICKKVTEDGVGLDQSVDALKALTTYYAVREKVRLKAGEPDDGNEGNFAEFAGAIHAAGESNGTPSKLPGGRRDS